MEYEEVKFVVNPYSGRLFVMFDDGSMLPVQTDRFGVVYIDYHPAEEARENDGT